MGSALQITEVDAAVGLLDPVLVENLVKLLTKICENPADPKYRKLKLSSKLFGERFASPAARRVLHAVGWIECDGTLVLGDECGKEWLETVISKLQDESLTTPRDVVMDLEDAEDDDDEELRRAIALSSQADNMVEEEDDDEEEKALQRAIALSTEAETEDERRRARVAELFGTATKAGAAPNSAAVAALGVALKQPLAVNHDLSAKPGFEARIKEVFELATAAGVPANEAVVAALRIVQEEQAGQVEQAGQEEKPKPEPLRQSTVSKFVRLEDVESVDDETLDVIRLLYREDGITFVDPSFPPNPKSLYVDPTSADTWRCVACQSKNPLPQGINSAQEVLNVLRQQAQDQALREVKCGTCGKSHPLQEVALRPSDWARPMDLRDDLTMQTSAVPWVVFRGEPRADDIRQGGVGNCWFVCALSVLADAGLSRRAGGEELYSPLRRCVVTTEYQHAGAYQIRLCRAGTWHTVLVDDTFPVNALGTLAYLKAARRSLWGVLIEKAAAKLHGSYEALAGGTFAEAFHMLTGFPVHKMTLDQYSEQGGAAGALMNDSEAAQTKRTEAFSAKFGSAEEAHLECFAQLYSFLESGFAMGVSTFVTAANEPLEKEMRGLGLQTRHAYGVLDVKVAAGDQLIKLRNPNGVALWKGDWSKNSHKWTYALQQELKVDQEDEGVFWVCVEDFAKYFVELTVCRLLPAHLEARSFGWLASGFGCGECVLIETYARNSIELAIYQEAHAARGEASNETALDIGLLLVKCEATSVDLSAVGPRGALVTHASRVAHHGGAACSATLEQDDYPTTRYLVVPLCFSQVRATEPRKFALSLHSTAPLTIETVKFPTATLAAAYIKMAMAQGERKVVLKSNVDALVLYILEDEVGFSVVAENLTTFPLIVDFDASRNTTGFHSTRNALCSQDVLPARTRQILCVLSRKPAAKSVQLAYEFSASQLEQGVYTSPEGSHIPALEDLGELADLHKPQRIDGEGDAPSAISPNALAEALAAMQR